MEIDSMEGYELNAAVGQRIMGLPVLKFERGMKCPVCGGEVDFRLRAWCGSCCEWFYEPYRDYSGYIGAAQEVIDRLRTDGYHFTCNDRGGDPWWAEFANDDYTVGGQASGDTLEVAICRAGLNLMADIARLSNIASVPL